MNRQILKLMAQARRTGKGAATAMHGPVGQRYMQATEKPARNIQEALVDIIGGGSHPIENPSLIRQQLGEMAGSEKMLNLLQLMPAAAATYGGASLTKSAVDGTIGLLTGDEPSFADEGMDILGMGAGALGGLGAAHYGLNRGTNRLGGTTSAGAALAAAAGAGAGTLGVDILQGLF